MKRARRAAAPTDALDAQLVALREAAAIARGRLHDPAVDRAEAVVARAGVRLGLGLSATVVALAGPTGAGKSTLFNAVVGAEVARPGHLRPTTSQPTAAVWGDVGDDLLDWLDVPNRHRVDGAPGGLVLLDLPDFDSVEAANRAEADRIVALADLTVWVVDPQKYADGVLHEQYLQPLRGHAATMLVVLNQADRLDPAGRVACVADIARLLAVDGVGEVPVLAVSASTGLGLDALRAELDRRVASREAITARLSADVHAAARDLAPSPATDAAPAGPGDRATLVAAMAAACGVPRVVDAVAQAHRRRGALAVGWPFLRWVRRFRPDPLRRLRLGERTAGAASTGRSSLPRPSQAQGAVLDAAMRTLAGRVGGDLPEPWPNLVRRAALSREADLGDLLDTAVTGVELGDRGPAWWSAIGALQWALAAAVLVGALWLLALAGFAYLQVEPPTPRVHGVPWPTGLLLGGALAGLLLAALAGGVNRLAAQRRARRVERALTARVGDVADVAVLEPVAEELAAYRTLGELTSRIDVSRTPRRAR
ncbi:MAG: transporter [Thermoleophilia bacterium]|nr:transporter [Thermoleophilia bacterium]